MFITASRFLLSLSYDLILRCPCVVWFANCVDHLKFQFQFSLVLFPSLDWTLTLKRSLLLCAKKSSSKRSNDNSTSISISIWILWMTLQNGQMNEKTARSDRQIFLTSIVTVRLAWHYYLWCMCFEHKLRSISQFNHGHCVKSILLAEFASNWYHFLLMFGSEIWANQHSNGQNKKVVLKLKINT